MSDYDDYDFPQITGTWTADSNSGTGTASGLDGDFDLRMIRVGTVFKNVKVEGNSATMYVTSSAFWDAYQGDDYIRRLPVNYYDAFVTAERIERNTWRYSFPNSGSTVTVKMTSDTTAEVTEYDLATIGSYINYSVSYSMTKRTDSTTDSPEDEKDS